MPMSYNLSVVTNKLQSHSKTRPKKLRPKKTFDTKPIKDPKVSHPKNLRSKRSQGLKNPHI